MEQTKLKQTNTKTEAVEKQIKTDASSIEEELDFKNSGIEVY